MEVHLHDWLLQRRETDPERADFFFVPAYGICMFEGGFLSIPDIDIAYKQLLTELPYFQRNGGRDHIFAFGSGMNMEVFRSWRELIPDSIMLTPETYLFNDFPLVTVPGFNYHKDIAIPGYLHPMEVAALVQAALPLERRRTTAAFLGRIDPSRGVHPTVRSGADSVDVRALIGLLQGHPDVVIGGHFSVEEMYRVMGEARFCLVPKGKSAWSLRFYEALFAGCVPVVLSDHWELPFDAVLDHSQFFIKWPMVETGLSLLEYLRTVSDQSIAEMREAAKIARCRYVYTPPLHEIQYQGVLEEVCKRSADAFDAVVTLLGRRPRSRRPFFGPPPGSGGAYPRAWMRWMVSSLLVRGVSDIYRAD
jgi:hypothetical protein